MKGLITIAKIIFAVPFIVLGLMHFMAAKDMTGLVPSFVPGGIIWIYITGVALIAAGISFIINRYAKLAGILLAVLLLIFIVTIWLPKFSGGDNEAMISLLKDLGLIGGALLISGVSKN